VAQAAVDRAEKYSREKHRRHSQLETENIDVADHGKKQQQRILCQLINHDKSFLCFCPNSPVTPGSGGGLKEFDSSVF
jgi:hypothetical protein